MTDILSLTRFVLTILMAAAGGFALVQTALAGIAIISASPQKKAEAMGRVKWIVIGAVLALCTYTLTAFVSWEMQKIGGSSAGSMSAAKVPKSELIQLPGNTHGNWFTSWIVNGVFSSITALLDTMASIFWSLSGFTGPAAMAKANVWTKSKDASWVMGIFPTQTWSAMMYVQHALYALVAIAALVSFVIQGIQVQNAPSSAVAKERAVTLGKNVVAAGLVLGLSPYGLGLLNAGVSDLTTWILSISAAHDKVLASDTIWSLLFGTGKTSTSVFSNIVLFGGSSSESDLGNALFNLVLSIVNLCMWVVYQWRRVVLAILITLMPLFCVGLVTGRRVDLIAHWWKEVTAYMLIPFVAALFLLVSRVFIGV